MGEDEQPAKLVASCPPMLTERQVEELRAIFAPARPPSPEDGDLRVQVEEVKAFADMLWGWYVAPEREIAMGVVLHGAHPTDAGKLREQAMAGIRALYEAAHDDLAKVKRIGLMLRINRLAEGRPHPPPDTDLGLLGAYDKIVSDRDMALIVADWKKQAGAKSPSKWERLRRLLANKCGVNVTVDILKGEWKKLVADRKANGLGVPK